MMSCSSRVPCTSSSATCCRDGGCAHLHTHLLRRGSTIYTQPVTGLQNTDSFKYLYICVCVRARERREAACVRPVAHGAARDFHGEVTAMLPGRLMPARLSAQPPLPPPQRLLSFSWPRAQCSPREAVCRLRAQREREREGEKGHVFRARTRLLASIYKYCIPWIYIKGAGGVCSELRMIVIEKCNGRRDAVCYFFQRS